MVLEYEKILGLDSDNNRNQNVSFQDTVNLQFILLCDIQRIARSIDGVTASVVLLEKQQDALYGGGTRVQGTVV